MIKNDIVNLQHYKNKKIGDSFRNPDGKIRIMDLLLSDPQLRKDLGLSDQEEEKTDG
jgi:hypothetical protein